MIKIIEQIKHNKLLLIILILIIIILVVLLVSKITYAYLDKPESITGVTEGKITASGDKLIFTKGNDLSLALSTDNFNYATEGNVTTSTNSKVTLIANSKTKEAKAKYATGINIIKNTFVSSDGQPELILQVKCDDEEIKKIDNLEYNENLKGFDITNKVGIFNAAKDKEIKSTDSSTGTTHTWEYTIILINKEIDQSINETAQFSAKSYIAEKEMLPIEKVLLANSNKDGKITLYHHNENDLTDSNMENKELIANDDSYRFSGADADVNNYVCLDSLDTGACETDEDLYRIIGLFKNYQGQYEMKLIKAQGATAMELGDNETAKGGSYKGLYNADYSSDQSSYKGSNWETLGGYYWNNSNSSYSTNMWQYSNLNTENLNKFYYNYIITKVPYLENHITEHNWTTGGYAVFGNAKTTYDNELENGKVKVGDNVCFSKNDYSKILCTKDDIEYINHIGLMYTSDYLYSTLPIYWKTLADEYYFDDVKNNNWLYIGISEWTISRDSSYPNNVRIIGTSGRASNNIYHYEVTREYAVRPCFYLSLNAKIKEGEGSKKIPYRLSWN